MRQVLDRGRYRGAVTAAKFGQPRQAQGMLVTRASLIKLAVIVFGLRLNQLQQPHLPRVQRLRNPRPNPDSYLNDLHLRQPASNHE